MRAGAKICGYGKHKMANPDYSFMRTGLGGGLARDPSWSEEDWRTVKSALLVFTEDALVLAARYAQVRGNGEIQASDLISCLKVQTQRGMRGLLQAHQVDSRMREYETMLQQDHDEDEEEEEEEAGEAAAAVPHALDVLNDEQLCAIVDLADQNFAQWEPRDRMESILKQAVQKTEEQFAP